MLINQKIGAWKVQLAVACFRSRSRSRVRFQLGCRCRRHKQRGRLFPISSLVFSLSSLKRRQF